MSRKGETVKRHLQYLKYVIRHKWYVFIECLRYGLIWRGIKHDWTKFLPVEWFPYARTFYAPDGTSQYKPDVDFDRAWNHHQKANSHHWQYWLLSPDKPRPNFAPQSHDGGMSHSYLRTTRAGVLAPGLDAAIEWDDSIKSWWHPDMEVIQQLEHDLNNTPIPLQMPDADMKEMLADWRGAGRALGRPNTWEWYNDNKNNIFLHIANRLWIETELEEQRRHHEAFEKAKGMGLI